MGKQRNKPFHDTRKMLDKQASDKGGHLMKCRDCEKLEWGYDEGERVWWCAKRGHCPDLDVERNCSEFSLKKPDIFTALSTLQAENEKLRAELEQVKRERDSALKDLERLCRDDVGPCEMAICELCAYNSGVQCSSSDRQICDGYNVFNWKWRGPKKED